MEEKALKDQVIEHIAKFSLGTTIKGIGQFINQYFAAFLLGPAVFGIWQGVKLVLSYSGLVGLGTVDAMHREVPILKSKGEVEKILEVKNTSFIFNFIGTILLSLGIFFSTFFIKLSPETLLALRFISLIVFIQFFRGFYETWLKANNEFDAVSKIAVIDGVGLAISVVLIFFFSFLGFLVGQALSLFIGTVYACLKSKPRIKSKWNSKIFKKLIIIGFPILLIAISGELFNTVDRLLILKFLNVKSLGIYSLGWLAFMPIMFILYSANSVMYPRFSERFGMAGKDGALRKFITLPTQNLALIIPVLIGGIVVILPTLVQFFLPQYIQGVDAARILLFGLFFVSTIGMAGNFFLATNRQNFYLGILLGSILANLIISYILIKLGLGIIGVALGTSISYFIFFLAMIIISLNYCGDKKKEIFSFLFKILIPVAYVVLISFLITRIVNIGGLSNLDLIKNALLKEVVFLVLSSYLIYLTFRNLEIKKFIPILWKRKK